MSEHKLTWCDSGTCLACAAKDALLERVRIALHALCVATERGIECEWVATKSSQIFEKIIAKEKVNEARALLAELNQK